MRLNPKVDPPTPRGAAAGMVIQLHPSRPTWTAYGLDWGDFGGGLRLADDTAGKELRK